MAKDPREQFFDRAHKFTPLVAVDSDNARFLISTTDQTVAKRLFIRRRRGEMDLLANAVAILDEVGQGHWVEETTFLDVGANIGTSTITALRSHSFARAVACEPEPENCRLLKVNALLNDLDDLVLVLQVAASDANGTATLAVHALNSGGHQVVAEGKSGPTSGDPTFTVTVEVEKITVDYLIERGILKAEDVGMIWMDVQGHEGHILSGASRLTARGTPAVLEVHPGLLALAGGAERLQEVIADLYTHFVDLRHARGKDGPEFELKPSSEIPGLIENLEADPSGRFTDILTLRL